MFAFVYPEDPLDKNEHGQYIIHFCDMYLTTYLGEQIEDLTHESSHHLPAATKDVCMVGGVNGKVVHGLLPSRWSSKKWIPDWMVHCDDEDVAYGREACEKLAVGEPGKALINADNFCYFINDAVEY